jgi:hypothetical protein
MPSGWIKGVRAIRVLIALWFAAYNLVPLYGLYAWHWDAFQLLILYWSETVVLAAWTLLHIAFVPSNLLGDVTINGKTGPATHASLIGIMALVVGIFCTAHLLFLCVLFSGDWFRRLHGVGDFLRTFYIDSDAWIPLVIVTLAGGADVLTGPYRPNFVDALALRLNIVAAPATPPRAGDAVGNILGGLLGRIVLMQVAIIFGAWAVMSWGSVAPLAIIVGLKTVYDLGHRAMR